MGGGQAKNKPLRDVAAVVIQRDDGRVLLLQRGATAPTFPNHWGPVTGVVEPGEGPVEAALRELAEEIGIEGRIVRGGEPFQVDIGASIVRVWPFLCAIDPGAPITLADENQRYEWVPLGDVLQRETIPQIDQDFRALGLL
jgi:8-oxo-dGTP pyrophosphatase MutT (NUDIX family)